MLAGTGQASCSGVDRTKMMDERQCVQFAADTGLPYLKTMTPCYETDYFGNPMNCTHDFQSEYKMVSGGHSVSDDMLSGAATDKDPYFAMYSEELMKNQLPMVGNGTLQNQYGYADAKKKMIYAYDGMDNLEKPPYRAYKPRGGASLKRGDRRYPPTWNMRFVEVKSYVNADDSMDDSDTRRHLQVFFCFPV